MFIKPCECLDYELSFTFPQWYYYVRQRDKSEMWKCQPNKWLSPDLERHEILLGSLSLLITSTLTALLTCYLSNGGWSTVYYTFDDYTWIWWFLQWPAIFIYQVRNCNRGDKNTLATHLQTLSRPGARIKIIISQQNSQKILSCYTLLQKCYNIFIIISLSIAVNSFQGQVIYILKTWNVSSKICRVVIFVITNLLT